MKKIISLLLILVLSLGMLTGVSLAAYEKPEEVSEAEAGVVVTSSSNSDKFYFETLTQELISWVCHDVPGDKTIKLLKDLEPKNPSDSSSRFLSIPANTADWESSRGGKDALILDLNDKTITFASQSNFINIDRYGLTVKNGTILYTCVGANRCPFMLGGSKGRTATTNGKTLWTPKLVLDNMNVFVLTEGSGGAIFQNYIFGSQITITDSLLYTRAWNAIVARQTNQQDAGETPYEGDYIAEMTVTGSTIVSGNNHAIAAENEAPFSVTIMDSTLVSNSKKGGMIAADTTLQLDTKGEEPTEQADWSQDTAAGTITGTAYHFGVAGLPEPLPFTDVAEGQWYYEFVDEMFRKGIINGMTATTFVPDGTLTYGQALKLITLGIGETEKAATDSHWASGYQKFASDSGWLDSSFQLDDPITRLAFCRIAAAAKGLTDVPESNPFTDTEDLSVLALVKAGVINGMTATTFAPDNVLTRAQIAKIISLLSKL